MESLLNQEEGQDQPVGSRFVGQGSVLYDIRALVLLWGDGKTLSFVLSEVG